MIEIEIREFKKHDIQGGIVVDGLPNTGLVSPIFSSYLVGALQLDQVACLDSEYFPPASMIFAGKPKFPARIYASTNPRLAVFVAEFTPPPLLDRPLAKKIFSWAIEQKASMIITSVPIPVLEDNEVDNDAPVLGVGSTQGAREMLAKAGVGQFDIGIITGTPGVLLNEGRWANFDVIALIVKAHPAAPDHRAAAKIIESLGKLVPGMRLDVGPLYEEATRIGTRLKMIRAQASESQTHPQENMYR